MTIRRYIRDGLLRPIRPGRDYLIPVDQLDALVRPKPGPPKGRGGRPKRVTYDWQDCRITRPSTRATLPRKRAAESSATYP